MKLKRLAIQNIRSFGQKREVEFHDDFTILIGPNGGGKSNLLDVITVGVRQFFLRPWGLTREEDTSGPYYIFRTEDPFGNIINALSRFAGAVGPSLIEFDWQISQQDVANIQSIVGRLESLRESARRFREGEDGLDWLKQLQPGEYAAGDTLRYVVEGATVRSLSGEKGERFRRFLMLFNKVNQIDEDQNSTLTTPFLHFPPYRGAAAQGLRISLAGQNRWSFELGYARATSRQTMSLIHSRPSTLRARCVAWNPRHASMDLKPVLRKTPKFSRLRRLCKSSVTNGTWC
jgi:putative ATP-dependent endonuclease of OLD family